jgi:F0F1-type ATP synthase epsilon subunit
MPANPPTIIRVTVKDAVILQLVTGGFDDAERDKAALQVQLAVATQDAEEARAEARRQKALRRRDRLRSERKIRELSEQLDRAKAEGEGWKHAYESREEQARYRDC